MNNKITNKNKYNFRMEIDFGDFQNVTSEVV